MRMFKFLFDKKNTALVPSNIALSQKETNCFNVHPDIVDLIWIANGERRNFFADNSGSKSTFTCNGFTWTMTMSGAEEPSLIDTRQPVFHGIDYSNVERPPYYPTYNGLTPEQKGVYWHLLSNPYNSNIDIGFVFILYYGLERFLLGDKYEKAFNVIYKLRDVHKNNSFQFYTTNALALTAIIRSRADLLERIITPVRKTYEQHGFVNLLLLSKFLLELPITSAEIIAFAKAFGFTNNNYIKKYPDMFEMSLINLMNEQFDSPEIWIDGLIDKSNFKNMPTESVPIFANISIREKMIPIPNLIEYPKFKAIIINLLEGAHNNVKLELKNLRKGGKVPAKKTTEAKPKEVLTFDYTLEEELLKNLHKAKTDLDKHFAMISLQDFYYKYRDIDKKYLDLCIKYCCMDIESLDDIQKSYHTSEIQRLKYLKDIYSTAEINQEMANLKAFEGRIPAFSRLAIIYEKSKDYDMAISVCQKALSYYKKYGISHYEEEFTNRLDKVVRKKTK